MMDALVESGMTFGPYAEEDFFHIEKSKMHKRVKELSTVEFILRKKNTQLYFVEAKPGAPQQPEDLDRFTKEICKKFADSLQLFLAGYLQCKEHWQEIGENIRNLELKRVNFKFILVLKDHEKDWLPPVQACLEDKIRRENMQWFKKVWNSEIIVLNEDYARAKGLIQ